VDSAQTRLRGAERSGGCPHHSGVDGPDNRASRTKRILKEDVLEQVVEDYLQLCGYFTRHNLRFKPAKSHLQYVASQDSVPSDVAPHGCACMMD
jgi:hypothetical protein